MSYYAAGARRPIRRKKDSTPVILAIITIVGIPALAFAVYKFVILKPVADPAATVAYTSPAETYRSTTRAVAPLPKPPAAQRYDETGELPNYAEFEPVKPQTQFNLSPGADFSGGNFSGGNFSGGGMTSGGSGNVSGAVASAVAKIKESVELNKTLVIWLVDRTPSCESRRAEVARQLEAAYPTLAPAPEKGAKPEDARLLSAVCSFATDVQYETKEPTADPAEVRTAMTGIKADAGNVENTFKAIETVVGQYASYAAPPHSRYLTVVVVTDEVGNDQQERDRVADLLKRNSVPLYVIGQAAAFGSTGSQGASAEGANGQTSGPESRDVEWVSLEFPGGMSIGGPVGGDTGIGPYSLTYLCRESQGEFFAAGGMGPGVMLPPQYAPKYLSEKDYQVQVGANKAMAALFAATKLLPAKQIAGAATSFAVDENGLAVVRDIDLAQRPIALILPEINALYDTLKKGEGDRAKVVEPRHQAAFDVAIGRAMAAKVRAEGYIVLLAAFKAGRKTASGAAGTWSLNPAEGIEKNSVLDGMAKKSRQYLEGVIANHPNTPWAQAAQQELSTPIGWAWQEL